MTKHEESFFRVRTTEGPEESPTSLKVGGVGQSLIEWTTEDGVIERGVKLRRRPQT